MTTSRSMIWLMSAARKTIADTGIWGGAPGAKRFSRLAFFSLAAPQLLP
jgi:hypothetical protein